VAGGGGYVKMENCFVDGTSRATTTRKVVGEEDEEIQGKIAGANRSLTKEIEQVNEHEQEEYGEENGRVGGADTLTAEKLKQKVAELGR
jgi:hypothetical protein